MVNKNVPRKLSKEALVDLVGVLSIKVDKLTLEIQELKEEVQRLKTPRYKTANDFFPAAKSKISQLNNDSIG